MALTVGYQDPKYEVWQINVYPTTTSAVQVITTLIYAWTSDSIAGGRRWPFFIFGGCMNILCYVSLAIWDIPIGWKWACFGSSNHPQLCQKLPTLYH